MHRYVAYSYVAYSVYHSVSTTYTYTVHTHVLTNVHKNILHKCYIQWIKCWIVHRYLKKKGGVCLHFKWDAVLIKKKSLVFIIGQMFLVLTVFVIAAIHSLHIHENEKKYIFVS